MPLKKCSQCNQTGEFYKNSHSLDGYTAACKKCINKRQKAKRSTKAYKKRFKIAFKKYRSSKRGKIKLKEYRDNAFDTPQRFAIMRCAARKKGKTWTLSKDQYLNFVSKSCEYCSGSLPPHGIALDRIDSKRGYHLNNVVPCCTYCNLTKHTHFTYDEMKQVIGPAIRKVLRSRHDNTGL